MSYWDERNESQEVVEIFSNMMLEKYSGDITDEYINNIKILIDKRRIYSLALEDYDDKKLLSKVIQKLNINIKNYLGL